MIRSLAIATLIAITLLPAGRADAARLAKGNSLVLVGIGGHSGQFLYPTDFLARFESNELGGHLAYYRFVSERWTLGIAGSYQVGQLKAEENNPPGTTTYKTHSFTVRVGGDRYAFVDDDLAIYAGPGVLFTRGRSESKWTNAGFPPQSGSSEGPDATEVGLNARVGVYARLGDRTALFGHLGQVLSRTSGEGSDGKLTWWSSTHEGSLGLAFDF